jgi:UDP-GlcNAc:undecaprenyl-phosphate/decaprenyl-phosphate GlcNAc-1-phosphate transferase
MVTTILLAVCSFGLSLLLTPVFRNLALRLGLVDRPDRERKLHDDAVPRIGGLPILIACGGAFAILHLVGLRSSLAGHLPPLMWKLLPSAIVAFGTGLLDDLTGLRPREKLLGLTLAGFLACSAGLRIDSLAGYDFPGMVGDVLTVIWLVACANAFNLIDGLDGLASGVGLLATLTTMAAGLLHGDTGLVMVTAPLAGALFGFLRYNFNPASIFLGDCGSLWIGFTLGCYGVIWSQKSATVLGITAPLMALCIPLLDTVLSIARRFLGKRPIFEADHGHIHHRLLARGLTPRRVALLLYGVGGMAAALSLLQSTAKGGAGGFIIALFCGAVWVGIQSLGYQEFRVAAGILRKNDFRSSVKTEIALRRHEEELLAAETVEECWWATRAACREFGFTQIALRLAGHSFHERSAALTARQWTLHIPVSELDFVQLTHGFGSLPAPVNSLVDLLHRALSAKAAAFGPNPVRHGSSTKPLVFPAAGRSA